MEEEKNLALGKQKSSTTKKTDSSLNF